MHDDFQAKTDFFFFKVKNYTESAFFILNKVTQNILVLQP